MGMNCKTCKWWKEREKNEYFSEINPRFNPVTMEEFEDDEEAKKFYPYEVRFCKHPRLLFHDRPDADAASVFDGSDYMAVLATGPDFGCVNHEPNE